MEDTTHLSFPEKVYNTLKLCEQKGREDIISWEKDGKSFKVNDLETFQSDFLPRYFNTKKYATFTRTLNAFGFNCTRTGRQTGIYSHPDFIRGGEKRLYLIKRLPKKKNRKAAPNHTVSNTPSEASAFHHARRSNVRPTAFNGDQIVRFPSLLDGVRHEDARGDQTVFGQLYNTVTSQVAERARYLVVRLPPGAQIAGIFDSDESPEGSVFNMSSSSPPNYATLESPSGSTMANSNMDTGKDYKRGPISPRRDHILGSGENKFIAPKRTLVLGSGQVSPISDSTNRDESIDGQDYGIQLDPHDFDPIPLHQVNDDLEPIPWSPSDSPVPEQLGASSQPLHYSSLQTSLEPRTIEEMHDSPDDLNAWYRFLPIIPTPRLQAQLEYSSPLSLSVACYFLDMSSFGMWWSLIFTVGHTIQSMLTAYGPNSESFTLSPEIGIVPHHFMDMMWMHSHFSCLVLLPGLFGPSSMTLFNYFVLTQALNLSIGVKTNYHHIEVQRGVWGPGRWWLADIVRWIFLGYLGSFFTISVGDYYGNENLKVFGVFCLNLTVLWVWESYRLLLSTRGRVERQISISDKKRS